MMWFLYGMPVVCWLLIMFGLITAISVSLVTGIKLIGIALILYLVYFVVIVIGIYISRRW